MRSKVPVNTHKWEIEEIDGGAVGIEDFWICKGCGASGGVAWSTFGGNPSPPRHAFLAGANGLEVDNFHCKKAKAQIEEFLETQAKKEAVRLKFANSKALARQGAEWERYSATLARAEDAEAELKRTQKKLARAQEALGVFEEERAEMQSLRDRLAAAETLCSVLKKNKTDEGLIERLIQQKAVRETEMKTWIAKKKVYVETIQGMNDAQDWVKLRRGGSDVY